MVCQEINWRYQAHHCELFEGNAKPTQCFNCQDFGHMTIHCRHAQRCIFISRASHKPEDSIVKDDTKAHICTNCRGKHAAWHRECPTVFAKRAQAQVAFNNRLTRYRVDMPATGLPSVQDTGSRVSPHLDNRSPTMPPEERPIQLSQSNRRVVTAESPSHNAMMTANTTSEVMDRPLTPRHIDTAQPRPAPRISLKRAWTALQRSIYTKITPITEETTFAETVEAAKTDAIWHERRTRRSTTSAMCSQSGKTRKDPETISTTTTPMELDLE